MTDNERQTGALEEPQPQPQGVVAEALTRLEATVDGARAALTEAGYSRDVDLDAGIRQLAKLATERQMELDTLRPLAEDGRAFKSDLIERTIKEGVRAEIIDAEGKERWERMLGTQPVGEIKATLTDWTKRAETRLVGGQSVQDKAHGRAKELEAAKAGQPVNIRVWQAG